MKRLLIILTFGFLTNVHGQDMASFEKVLIREFSEKSTKDGKWVYYANEADIDKVETLSIKAIIPNYDFYKVKLTNYLGWHITQATCIVAFDSLESKILLIKPIWFSDINEPLLRLLTKKPFESKTQLSKVIDEVNQLMEVGSNYRFIKTGSTDNLITYDLIKGDSYITSAPGTSSPVQYKTDGIWRQIEIKISGLEIEQYKSTNLKTLDEVVVK
jgi:hypothetical protein